MSRGARVLAAALAAVAATACGNTPGGGDAAIDAGGVIDADLTDARVPTVPPEVDGRLTINEFMAANAVTIVDPSGDGRDWIELYNPTDEPLWLQDYALTDDLADPRRGRIGDVTIAPGGRVVLWADGAPALGPTHLGFQLAKEGGAIGLARPDGSYIDRVVYGAQEVDFSAARAPDGSDRWQIEWRPTPDAPNPDGGGQPAGLEVVTAPPEQVAAAGDLSERILGYDELPELALIVAPDAVAALEAAPFVYVPATLVFAGRAYGPVGVRLKGQNSFEPFGQKPSLRINVDEYVERARFFGLKDLTLNNMHGDLSMMHERLAYYVARRAGVPASRSNHALLTVNGQAYGLYANVETVKRQMIRRWFADDTGSLFEATDVDFVAADVPGYELEAGPDDRSLLSGLAAALLAPDADAAIAAAGAYVDLARFRRYWALCSVIGQFDAFPYSIPGDDYFVYADPVTNRLAFLPWGMDETFYSGHIDVVDVYSVLARRCRASPSCFQAYKDQVWEVQALTEQFGLAAERVRVIEQITPHVVADLRKHYTTAQVQASQSALYWFITNRRANLGAMLQGE